MDSGILFDDIDCIVIGDGSFDFILRLLKQNYDVFSVTQWGGVHQLTKVISTENLWLHFNFWVVSRDSIQLALQAMKGQFYLSIVTYYVQDISSYEYARDLYDRYFQDTVVPSVQIRSNNRGTMPAPVFHQDMYLLTSWFSSQSSQLVGAGMIAALCTQKQARVFLNNSRADFFKQTKFVCSSTESPFIEEKQSIFLWMFETYRRQNRNLKIEPELVEELRKALHDEPKQRCDIL